MAKRRHNPARDFDRAGKDVLKLAQAMLEGAKVGAEATGVLVANHAKDDHPRASWVTSSRSGGAVMGRPTNPDGTQRFFTRTARLKNSIRSGKARVDGQKIRVDVSAGRGGVHAVDYAPHVEFGTRRMAPFPFMRPAAISEGPKGRGLVVAAINERFEGAVA